jgi:PAS domain S-box-containing protein
VNGEECAERIHLVDEYSRLITQFNGLLESLRVPTHERNEEVWKAIELARAQSQTAWEAVERHLAEHRCLELPPLSPDHYAVGSGSVLERAALAIADVILVANDDRQFVEVNEAAADAFGLSRTEIVGRRIDEFFATAGGQEVPGTSKDFIAEGTQSGVCEISARGRQRRFEFRSKANFAPGLHLSVLREMKGDGRAQGNLVDALIRELADELPDDPSLETVRTDLLAASRSNDTDKTLRFYLSMRSLLREQALLKERLRKAESSKRGSIP